MRRNTEVHNGSQSDQAKTSISSTPKERRIVEIVKPENSKILKSKSGESEKYRTKKTNEKLSEKSKPARPPLPTERQSESEPTSKSEDISHKSKPVISI